MRNVFLDDLPRWGKSGKAKEGTINWKESVGYKVKFTYDDIEGEIEIIDYKPKTKDLFIKYLTNSNFKIKTDDLRRCYLGRLLNIRNVEFKIEIGTQFKDDKRYLIIIDREYKKDKNNKDWKYYKYKCNKCGYEGQISEYNLIKGKGCPCCDSKVAVLGVNTIWDTDRWMCDLGVSEEDAKKHTKSSGKKVNTICPNCGRVSNKIINDIYNNKSIGCSCSDNVSYPEKFMLNILEQLNINFKYQYKPNWCKYKYKNKIKQGKYDFYFELNNNKYIIETDGGFHKNDNNMTGQTVNDSKYIDDYKDKMAKENDIEVIRIDCRYSRLEYIKNNILTSKLIELFDLSEINWYKVQEFAISNLVKVACNYKRNNLDLSSTDIGRMMKLDKTTVIKYLKQGTGLGWCNYNPKEEMRKNHINCKKMFSKPVEAFKDSKSLGVFSSCAELERQSEALFGVKLLNQGISRVCNNKLNAYKGFNFKYM